MYMAYGWPLVIPLDSSGLNPNSSSFSDQIVYFKVLNRLLLVISPSHVELWSSSQHRVRLGKYKRDVDSIENEGENLRAVWSPDAKLIGVITSSFYLHIYKVQFTEKKILIGGKQPIGLFLATISLLLSEQIPFADKNLTFCFRATNSCYDTGLVSCIAWTPDNSAFAVGWKLRGLTVWSVSGCRLMSTIHQIGLSSVSSPVVKPNQDCKYEPMINGTSLMYWDEYGYRLYAIEERSSERIIAFPFGKCCLNRGLSGTTYVRQVIYGEDRLLIVQSEDTDELKILHLNLPVSYMAQNWPVLHVAASKDGMYLAVSGLHGLILYDIRLKRWRVFGDITQEQKIQCRGLL